MEYTCSANWAVNANSNQTLIHNRKYTYMYGELAQFAWPEFELSSRETSSRNRYSTSKHTVYAKVKVTYYPNKDSQSTVMNTGKGVSTNVSINEEYVSTHKVLRKSLA